MEDTFNSRDFIERVGKRLIQQLDDATSATTPSAVGEAMEQPVREQLEQIVPRGIGVGSGFVIDSYGNASKQTDVILYEKDICPVFSINNTPGTTYYPCEGVIAVGQVKSVLNRSKLKDDFTKIASVKQLRRHHVYHAVPHPQTGESIVLRRSYGNPQSPSVIDTRNEDKANELSQIFGFVLARSAQMEPSSLSKSFLEFTHEIGQEFSPSVGVFLNHGLITWITISNESSRTTWLNNEQKFAKVVSYDGPLTWKHSWTPQTGEVLRFSRDANPFGSLIRWIYWIYEAGMTSDIGAFERYIGRDEKFAKSEEILLPKNGKTLYEFLEQEFPA